MDVADIDLPHDRSAELCGVGPEDGDVVLYFHSPATSGEELGDAIDAAAQLRLRVLCVRRPSIECAEAERFVGRVADDVTTIVDAHAEGVPVPGRHDWLTDNWHTVLPRVRR